MSHHRVLIVGSGGREHALALKLAQSPQVGHVFVAPGNGGTALTESVSNVAVDADDIEGLYAFAREQALSLTMVGPEAPLTAGIVDLFQRQGMPIYGPSQAAAQLEGSKAYAKEFMRAAGIPTARSVCFSDYRAAVAYLQRNDIEDVVIKASGLAAGKGVVVCDTRRQAEDALHQILVENTFGAAGDEVLIEERLHGPEVSILGFCDGNTVLTMPPARDHKRIFDADQGPNTGGMGAFSPPPDVTPQLVASVTQGVLQAAVEGMARRGTPYVGILYAGIMLTADGPKVLEFNCRFGDPETQAILPLLESDLFEILQAGIEGRNHEVALRIRGGACANIVMSAPGYPGAYDKGLPISGVEEANRLADVQVYHAGTNLRNGALVSNGGRVLSVSATGPDLDAAVERAYAGVERIHFEGAHFRRDIGRASL